MLARRRVWLERIANWGTAIAVPLVVIVGFKLLLSARDGASPGVPPSSPRPRVPVQVLAPPIDASAPPVVDLRPSAAPTGSDRAPAATVDAAASARCATLERAITQLDADARAAADPASAGQLRERGQAARAQARELRCPLH